MSVGLGIFLSTLVMALLFLYAITRDRWNWERGVRLLFLGSVAIASLAGIGIASVYVWTLGSNIWKRSFSIVQTEYWGLRLGMSMEEVKHVKGIPDIIYEPTPILGKLLFSKTTRRGKTRGTRILGDGGIGRQEASGLTLSFDEERSLRSVLCYWSEFDDPLQCPAIEGIKIRDSRDQIIWTLGEPNRSGPSMNSEWLAYSIGAVFWLREPEKTVYMMEIRDLKYKLEEEK
jgi:hypothetical protein